MPALRFGQFLWFALGLGILAAMVLSTGRPLADILTPVLTLSLTGFIGFAALQAVILALAAFKWVLLLRANARNDRIRYGDALAATSLGTLAGQVLPIQIVTPAIRAWAARRFGISTSEAVGTSVFEQLFELVALASMAIVSALILAIGLPPAGALALGGLAALLATGLIRPVLAVSARILPVTRLAEACRTAAAYPLGLMAGLTTLSFLRYGALCALYVGMALAIAPQADAMTLILAYPLVLFAMSLPLLPAGLGAAELTWAGILVAAGSSAPDAALAAIAIRIVSTLSFLAALPLLLCNQSQKPATTPDD